MQGCERVLSPNLVYNHQASRLESLGDHHTPSGSQELQFAFTRTQSPFFRVNPIRFKSRETVELLTLSPHTLSRNCRLSESVAAGRCSRSASSSLLAFWSVLGWEPGLFFGASGRPWSAILAYRLTEERLTEKVEAAWLLPMPRRRASIIFLRRSSE